MDGKSRKIFPQMSDFASRKEWEAAYWNEIVGSKELLQLLVSSYEKHHFVMRAATAERLSLGKSYRQISEELWVSPQTLSSIKKAIHEHAYRSYLERSKQERKKKVYSFYKNKKRRKSGIPRKTKYGILYMPR